MATQNLDDPAVAGADVYSRKGMLGTFIAALSGDEEARAYVKKNTSWARKYAEFATAVPRMGIEVAGEALVGDEGMAPYRKMIGSVFGDGADASPSTPAAKSNGVEVPSFSLEDGKLVPVNQMGADALARSKKEIEAETEDETEALKPENDPEAPVIGEGVSLEDAKTTMQEHYKALTERRSQRAQRLQENLEVVAGTQPTPGNEEAFQQGLLAQAQDIATTKAEGDVFDEARVGTAVMSDGSRAVMTDGIVNGGGNRMLFENAGEGLAKVDAFRDTPTPPSGISGRPYSFSGEVRTKRDEKGNAAGQQARIWRMGSRGQPAPSPAPDLPLQEPGGAKAPPPLVETRAPLASLDEPLGPSSGIQTRPTRIYTGAPRTRTRGDATSLTREQLLSGEDPYHPDMNPARASRLLSHADFDSFRRARNRNFSQLTDGSYAG